MKFQSYQQKKSEEKVLKIAFINDTNDTEIRELLASQKGVELIDNISLDSLEKNKAIVNYGSFTTQVNPAELELVKRK